MLAVYATRRSISDRPLVRVSTESVLCARALHFLYLHNNPVRLQADVFISYVDEYTTNAVYRCIHPISRPPLSSPPPATPMLPPPHLLHPPHHSPLPSDT